MNDTWDWYYEGEEGQHEVNYMEENWNDYGYDSSWDWNDNSHGDTANYIGGINESHLTTGHKSRLHKHKSKSLLGKKTTLTTSWNDNSKSFQQFLEEDTTQLHFDIAAATQQQRNKKIKDTITHYIMYSNFKSYHHHMFVRRTTRQTYRYDLVENQFHNSTRLPTRRFLSTASSMFPTSRTNSGS